MKVIVKRLLLIVGTALIATSLVAGCGKSAPTPETQGEQQEQALEQNYSPVVEPQKEQAPSQNSSPSGEQPKEQASGQGNSPVGDPPNGKPQKDITQDTTFLNDAASILGITADTLKSELQSGKTLDQIIADHGMTMDQFRQKMPKPQQPPKNGN